jgi:hypothetical protein
MNTNEHGLFQRKSAKNYAGFNSQGKRRPPWVSARISVYQRFDPARLCVFALKEFAIQLL